MSEKEFTDGVQQKVITLLRKKLNEKSKPNRRDAIARLEEQFDELQIRLEMLRQDCIKLLKGEGNGKNKKA